MRNENLDSQLYKALDANTGFFKDISLWTKEIAEELARRNNIVKTKLTEEHWKIIEYVRSYYIKFNKGPIIVHISKNTGFSAKRICELFPCEGVVIGAYKLAGIPKPMDSGCL